MSSILLKDLNTLQKISFLFSSFFGLGLIKLISATYGSIFGLVFIFIKTNNLIFNFIIITFLFFLFYFLVRNLKNKISNDSYWIISDKLTGIGFIILIYNLQNNIMYYLITIIIYIIFDIFNSFPINLFKKQNKLIYIFWII